MVDRLLVDQLLGSKVCQIGQLGTKGTISNNYLLDTLIFIRVKLLELTKIDPLLKLMIICKAETIHNFSRRKHKLS